MHLSSQYNRWSLRCSWSTAWRRCANYIFILDLTPGLNVLGGDNRRTRWESFKCWDSVWLILEIYGSLNCKTDKPMNDLFECCQWIVYISAFLKQIRFEVRANKIRQLDSLIISCLPCAKTYCVFTFHQTAMVALYIWSNVKPEYTL